MNITWLDDNQETVVLDVLVSDESYLYEALQGEHALHLVFDTAEYTEIPLGAQCLFNGEYYTLQVPATIEKQHSTSYRVTAVFESTQYSLKKYTVKEVRWNSTTSTWDTARTGTMRFNFTATAREHLQLIVDNLNKREGTGVWSIAQSGCIETSEKLVSYDYTNVADALNTIAETFDTEWYITGHTIALKKVEYDKTDPLALSYGRGNGFKSGVGRTNAGDAMPVEVLNVQGTDRNIDFSKYNAKNLLLPKSLSFLYDDADAFSFDNGTTWERYDEETNTWLTILDYTPSGAQSYVTTDDGLSVMIPTSLQKTKQESNFDGTDIYPSRVCTVTSVETTTQSNQTLYDIIDITIPSDLNFADCVIAGETPSITFQTGMLAGRNFQFDAETGYVHASRKFKIVNEEIDGMIMPEPTAYYPQVGDKFVVFGIQLPTAYVCNDSTRTGASYDMLREAVANLHENRKAKYTFSGELDGIYSRQNWANIGTKIRIGEYISFTDDAFQSDPVLIRIVGIKTFVNSPYSPEIEMSNESSGSTVISELKKLKAQEVVTEDLHKDAIRQSKRDFAAAKATTDALGVIVANLENELGNFTEGISPITVETMQLLVGSPNLQFAFGSVSSGQFTKQQTSIYFENGKLYISFTGSYLLHYTLGLEKVMSTTANKAAMKVWKMNNAWQSGTLADGSKSYYVYAKVSRSAAGTLASLPTSTQAYELSETPIGMESAQNYYYLLIGFLNAEVDGERSFAPMYGYTEILPSQVSTDKIVSSDGTGVIIDLVNGTITGNITFTAPPGSDNAATINGLINSNTNVVTAGANAANAVNSIAFGGINLCEGSIGDDKNAWQVNNGIKSTPTQKHNGHEAVRITSTSSAIAWLYSYNKVAATKISAGDTITISAWVMANFTTESAYFILRFQNTEQTGGDNLFNVGGYFTPASGYAWKRITFTATVPSTLVFDRLMLFFTVEKGAADYWLNVTEIMVEKGSIASEWVIAPQDTDDSISAAQSVASTALSNANEASTAAQNAQNAANTAQGTIDTMNGDTVFSVIEKKSFRSEWVAINGVVNTASGSATATGSYSKAVAATSGTTVGHSDLDTAYDNLRTYLNDKQLNTNSNTSNFSQSTLGDYCKAYYNAETKLYNDIADYYAEQAKLVVANLSGINLCEGSVGNTKNPLVSSNANDTVQERTDYLYNNQPSVALSKTSSDGTTWFYSNAKVAASKLTPGESICVSAYVYTNFQDDTVSRFGIRIVDNNNQTHDIAGFYTSGGRAWSRITVKGTIPSNITINSVMFFFTVERQGYWLFASCFMVEQGEIATQWSFAPEDVTAAMKAEADAVREAQRYINEAMEQGTTTIGGGLVLSSMIQVCADAEHEQPRAGMNGIDPASSSGNPVRFWAGGAFDDAQYVMNNAKNDNLNIRRAVKAKPTKFVVGQDGTTYIGNVVIDSPDDSSVRIENGTIKFINVESNEFVEKTVFTGESKANIDAMLATGSDSGTIAASSATNVISGDKTSPVYSLYPTAVIQLSHEGTFTSGTNTAPFTGKVAFASAFNVSCSFGLTNIALVTAISGLTFTFKRKMIATAYLAGVQVATNYVDDLQNYTTQSVTLSIPTTAVSVSGGQLVSLQIKLTTLTTITFSGTGAGNSAIKLSSLTAAVPAITAKTLSYTRALYNNKIFANGMLMSSANNKYFGVCPSGSDGVLFEAVCEAVTMRLKSSGILQRLASNGSFYLLNPLVMVARVKMNGTNAGTPQSYLYNPYGIIISSLAYQSAGRTRVTHNYGAVLRMVVIGVTSVCYATVTNETTQYTEFQLSYNGMSNYNTDYAGNQFQFDVYCYDFATK